uniref:ARAD1C08140p n=1 Tax=Blastobotrys adeninivorans TaxID=409370 RepID=A0A060SZI2_BLAAD
MLPLQPERPKSQWWTYPRILDLILDDLSAPDLCNAAQVNRAFRNSAYEEHRWEDRLSNLGIPIQQTDNDPLRIEDVWSTSPLDALDSIKPSKGHARHAVVHLMRAYGPLYYSLVRSGPYQESPLSAYTPIEQAQVLSQVRRFSQYDPVEPNHLDRVGAITTSIDLFENAALNEFERGLDAKEPPESIQQFAHVLVALNGGDACVQLFLQKHHLLEIAPEGPLVVTEGGRQKLDVEQFQKFTKKIADSLNDNAEQIDQIFPPSTPVMLPLFERVLEDVVIAQVGQVIAQFKTENSTHSSGVRYLRLFPLLYELLLSFTDYLTSDANAGPEFKAKAKVLVDDYFGLYVQSYLTQELELFQEYCESELDRWEKESSHRQEATESFLWSNVARPQEKKDFMSSFKKVLMAPVSVIPFHSETKQDKPPSSTDQSLDVPDTSSRPTTPVSADPSRVSTPPTTEFDAMVAVMNSKMEGIKSLFSLELALTLIRAGKDSIERMTRFTQMSSGTGAQAKKQCENVFVQLVHYVGNQHIGGGFTKALGILNSYDPRQYRRTVSEVDAQDGEERDAVEPLAIFAELVNIGDLIQQMIHVFFEEELVLRKLIDKGDFLSTSVKAKKKFEQLLDDNVANGLNRGIDVLVDQMDFVFVTQQLGSDFNPIALENHQQGPTDIDIGPSIAAKKVVSLLKSHIHLLVGSTEKSLLDVFQQEVGLRFYSSICKHIKRQTISTDGSIKLICDLNYYYDFIRSLKQKELVPYFIALKEVGNLFLIDGSDAKELGKAISDMGRFRGVMQPEEVYEFVQRRADWPLVRRAVERVMYGFGVDCIVM